MQHPEEGTIHAWLDGELDAPDAAGLEAHIAECSACAALVAEARGLTVASSRILGALDEVPSGVLPDARAPAWSKPTLVPTAPDLGVHRAMSGEHRSIRRARRWFNPQVAAAAAVLVMVVGTWTVLQRSDSAPAALSPPAESTVSATLADSATTAAVPPASAPLAAADEAASRAELAAQARPMQGTLRRSADGAAAGVSVDYVEADASKRRDAAANVAAARQAVAKDAGLRKERIDTVREARPAAPAPQRLARGADSITSNETRRLLGEMKAQVSGPPPATIASSATPQAAERRRAPGLSLDQRLATGSVCYAIDRTPRALQLNVPSRIELRPDNGPTVGERAFRVVRVPGAIPEMGTWYWIEVADGTLYLAQVEVAPAVIRQLAVVSATPDATGVRGVVVPCETR